VSQRNVELLVGKLVTDEQFRRRFAAERELLLAELAASGIELTPCELAALAAFDPHAAERCARWLDPRLQKADLRSGHEKKRDRLSNSGPFVRRRDDGRAALDTNAQTGDQDRRGGR
jgi:hypothetical protein